VRGGGVGGDDIGDVGEGCGVTAAMEHKTVHCESPKGLLENQIR
jgi:hypothetical protein